MTNLNLCPEEEPRWMTNKELNEIFFHISDTKKDSLPSGYSYNGHDMPINFTARSCIITCDLVTPPVLSIHDRLNDFPPLIHRRRIEFSTLSPVTQEYYRKINQNYIQGDKIISHVEECTATLYLDHLRMVLEQGMVCKK